MGIVGKCCCVSLLLTKVLWLALTLGPLVLMYVLYVSYIKPWGEDQIRELSHGLDRSNPALNCSGCVLGINMQFPPNTTGFLHTLDTHGGKIMSSVVGISLAASVGAGVASMAWASFLPGAATIGSLGSNVHEMIAVVEQAQFIGLLGQLQTSGAPVFFQEFTKELAWVNFNFAKGVDAVTSSLHSRKLSIFSAQTSETGVERYAATLGVEPEDLFYYTLMIIAIVMACVLAIYVLVTAIMSCISKKRKGNIWVDYFRKVIWAYVMILLLSLYIVAMTGSYKASSAIAKGSSGAGTVAIVLSSAIFGLTMFVGLIVIATNSSELDDLGTYEHEQRPFNAKYGPYYEEYNADNRYFFVPKAIVAVCTGIVVGIVSSTNWQLGLLIAANALYLILIVAREPFLLRFLYYIGVISAFLKVFLLMLMLILSRDDVFPQTVRDNVAYVIVAINMIVFGLLVIRQIYLTGHKFVRNCTEKKHTERADFNEVNSPSHSSSNRTKNHDLERGQNNENHNNHASQPAYTTPVAPNNRNPQQSNVQSGHRNPREDYGNNMAQPNLNNQPSFNHPHANGNPNRPVVNGAPSHNYNSQAQANANNQTRPGYAISNTKPTRPGQEMKNDFRPNTSPSNAPPQPFGVPSKKSDTASVRSGESNYQNPTSRTTASTASSSQSTQSRMASNHPDPSGRRIGESSNVAIGVGAGVALGAAAGAYAVSRSKKEDQRQQHENRGSLPNMAPESYSEAAPGMVVMPEYDLDKELNLQREERSKLMASFADSSSSYDRNSGYAESGKMSFQSSPNSYQSRSSLDFPTPTPVAMGATQGVESPVSLLESSSRTSSESRDASSRLDALVAKYLTEDMEKEERLNPYISGGYTGASPLGISPVNICPPTRSQTLPVEAQTTAPHPLRASKSLGAAVSPRESEKDDHPTRHSDSGVYNRYIADGNRSFMSSEDEIEL